MEGLTAGKAGTDRPEGGIRMWDQTEEQAGQEEPVRTAEQAGQEDMNELPPYITSVDCRPEGGTSMNYHVEFDTKDTQISDLEFTIFLEDSSGVQVLSVPLMKGWMAGDLKADIVLTKTYYLAVAPSRSPGRKSKRILAPHSRDFSAESLEFTEPTVFCLHYQCNDLLPVQVTAVLDGVSQEGAALSRSACLHPFEREVSLERLGFESIEAITVSAYAEYKDCGAAVTLSAASQFHLVNRLPVIKRVEFDGEQIRAETADVLYEGAGLVADIYEGGRLRYRSGKAEPVQGKAGVYLIPLPAAAFSTGPRDGYEVSFRVWGAGILSAAGVSHRLIFDAPVTASAHFFKTGQEAFAALSFYDSCRFPHSFELSSAEETTVAPPVLREGLECLAYPFKGQETVRAAYCFGAVRGPFGETLSLKMDGYYLFGDGEAVGICRSRTPILRTDSDILAKVKGIPQKSAAGANGVFTLKDGVLTIAGTTWKLKEGRDGVREAYTAFLQELETAGYPPAGIRAVRRLIGRYLPQTMEEFAFYNYYFDNRFPEKKSTIELFPGLILEASYSAWQYVGDVGSSEYLNGNVASGREYRTVVDRAGSLCLDPFLPGLGGGEYVDLMKQPAKRTAKEEKEEEDPYSTAGGAAFVDLGAEKLCRPYLLLAYHSKFPRADAFVNPIMSRNTALLAAGTYGDMITGRDYFFQNDTTHVPGLGNREFSGGYLRGRVQITPCVRIGVCDSHRLVPAGTTVGDMAAEYGLTERDVQMRRDGLPVTAEQGLWELPVFAGDEITAK